MVGKIVKTIEQKIAITELQAKILETLKFGKDNAMSRKEINKRLPNYDDRKIRLVIESLRREHYPILMSLGKPAGYYLPGNPQEVDACLETLRSYIINLCLIRRDIKIGASEWKYKFLQLPMTLN
jgi:hypothetical protein